MFHPPASEEERETVQARLSDVLEDEDDVVLAYLHGSFVESMYRDIDVAVLLSEPPEGGEIQRRSLRLSVALTRALDGPVEVDVRALNEAPLAFRFEALRKGRRLVCKDDDRRVAYEVHTIRAFHDFRYHLLGYGREALDART